MDGGRRRDGASMCGLMAATLGVTAFVLGVAYGVAGATWFILRTNRHDTD